MLKNGFFPVKTKRLYDINRYYTVYITKQVFEIDHVNSFEQKLSLEHYMDVAQMMKSVTV